MIKKLLKLKNIKNLLKQEKFQNLIKLETVKKYLKIPILFFSTEIGDRKSSSWLLIIFAFLLVVFIFWSSFFEIEQVVSGEAKVQTNTNLQTVQHMEGGIVSKIHIKTGDLVSTNQPLITLSEVQSSSDYQTSRGEYLSNMGKLTRLEAEFSGVSSIDFPAYLKEEAPEVITTESQYFISRTNQYNFELSTLNSQIKQKLSEVDSAEYEYYLALGKISRLKAEIDSEQSVVFPEILYKEAKNIIFSQKRQFESRMREFEAELSSINSKILQKKSSLKGLEDEYKRNITMLEIAKEEYKLISNLVKKGLESKLEGIRSLKELNQTTGKVESLKTQIEQIKEEIRELEYKKSAIKEEKVAINLEELSVEESSLLLLKEKILQLNQEVQELTFQKDSFVEERRSSVLNDIKETRSKTQTLKESLKGRADILDRTIIRSPIVGTVNQIHTSTVGGVIKPGEVIVEIVPIGSELVVEAKILPSDIGFIASGMRSRIKLSSYDFSIFGDLEGSVKLVSADSIQDEQGNIFYKVKVKPDTSFIEWKNEKLPLLIGMTGSVDIITSKRTILSYISSPVTRTFMSAFREQ